MTTSFGYQQDFLGWKHIVPFPKIGEEMLPDIAPVIGSTQPYLHYQKYSTVQHAQRKLPLFTACNIDGKRFIRISRTTISGGSDSWAKDPRIPAGSQFGVELYQADFSIFDKGHLVKREDPQWGDSLLEARDGAVATFFYTNATPQHARLNRSVWRRIEDYILHKETIDLDAKVTVFTGPVLKEDDPEFVTEVDGEVVKIPELFWKMVYFVNQNSNELNRVGFLVGQAELLKKDGIVKPRNRSRGGIAGEEETSPRFQDFSLSDTYQVHPGLIEALTGLTFAPARDPILPGRENQVILQEVQVKSRGGLGEEEREPAVPD